MIRQPIPRWAFLFSNLFLLVAALLPLRTPHVVAAPATQNEPVTGATTAHTLFVPMVKNGNEQHRKMWSGIHLGNISRASRYEWNPTQYWYINPQLNRAAAWPAVIVVQSDQIYNINRNETIAGCPIIDATVRLPKAFQYLQAAANAGSKIVIRITPSPGSFLSWAAEASNDRRMVVINPVGVLKSWALNQTTAEYVLIDAPSNFEEPSSCKITRNGEAVDRGRVYRSLRDIADEIKAIYALNRAFGWAEYGFEPANEPNIEWFGVDSDLPSKVHPGAWEMMDLYFLYLMRRIEELQSITPTFQPRVFTPPMAQSEYETGLWMAHCKKNRYFTDDEGDLLPYPTGYERMRNAIEASDGFSWHNYWNPGAPFETYADCNGSTEEGGQHISYYFPEWLKQHLATSGKPLLISEADLFSPWQSEYRTTAIPNKDAQPTAAADSLHTFLQIEYGALQQQFPNNGLHVALWLLNDNIYSPAEMPADENCTRDNNCRIDHNWHEAYQDQPDQIQTLGYSDEEITRYGLAQGALYAINAAQPRPWFTAWWNGPEE